MIGLDTNVLVRYLVQDDRKEARAATRVIETRCTADDPGIVGVAVLCELVWVLSRAYKYSRNLIAEALRRILTAEELAVEPAELAWRALKLYELGPGDFADYLIGLVHREHGATATVTFDRRTANSDLFELLTAPSGRSR